VSAPDPSAENPYAGQGPVLLDIGGEVGALVVTMPARLDGVEVEIRPLPAEQPPEPEGEAGRRRARDGQVGHRQAGHGHHPHVAVVPRPTGSGLVHSLVYGEVIAGTYLLCPLPEGVPVLEVTIAGGAVTEVTWE
jgi:hypothetical protein